MPLPDVTLTLGAPQPIRLLGRSLTVAEARQLAQELEAAAELADKRAMRDLEKRIGTTRESPVRGDR